MAECATVHDLTAYRRKRAAALLVRATRHDVCCYCGERCELRDRLASDLARANVAHFECWLLAEGDAR